MSSGIESGDNTSSPGPARRVAARSALEPVMKAWIRSIWGNLDAIPRPQDEPRGHAPGPDPVRVLLIGNGPSVGYGVRSHELALPGQTARHLATDIDRGVEVIAVTGTHVTASTAIAALDERPADALDAAIVTLGFMEALTLYSPSEWTDDLSGLIRRLRRDTADLPILFIGPQDIRSIALFDTTLGAIAQRHALHLNALGRELTSHDPDAAWELIPPLRADGERHRPPSDFSLWGHEIAGHLSRLMDDSSPGWRHPATALQRAAPLVDNEARLDAVARFRRLTSDTSVELDRVVDLAQRVFGTQGAAITLIDHEKQWVQRQVGVVGDTPDGIPRETSICYRTIDQDDVMVVPDAKLDDRFSRGPLTDSMRFYAGYPLVSPEGHRLGALCVFDPSPREDQTTDPSLLREVGLLAQRALWNLAADDTARGTGSGPTGTSGPGGLG